MGKTALLIIDMQRLLPAGGTLESKGLCQWQHRLKALDAGRSWFTHCTSSATTGRWH